MRRCVLYVCTAHTVQCTCEYRTRLCSGLMDIALTLAALAAAVRRGLQYALEQTKADSGRLSGAPCTPRLC